VGFRSSKPVSLKEGRAFFPLERGIYALDGFFPEGIELMLQVRVPNLDKIVSLGED
jgi:hypothetical protein